MSDDDTFVIYSFCKSCPLEWQIRNHLIIHPESKMMVLTVPCTTDLAYELYQIENLENLITVLVIDERETVHLANYDHFKFSEHWDPIYNFVFSQLTLSTLAILIIFVASIWNGNIRYSVYRKKQKLENSQEMQSFKIVENGEKSQKLPEEDQQADIGSLNKSRSTWSIVSYTESINITPMKILLYIFILIGSIVASYYIVHSVDDYRNAAFVFYTTCSVFFILRSLKKFYVKNLQVLFTVQYGSKNWSLDGFYIPIFLISILLPFLWKQFVNEASVWTLENIIGISYCIFLLQIIKLSSLKVCTALMTLFFLVELSVVIIRTSQPVRDEQMLTLSNVENQFVKKLMKSRCDASRKDQVPNGLKMPKLLLDDYIMNLSNSCLEELNYSIPYMHIFIPGLLTCYCFFMDKVLKIRYHLYFTLSIVSYAISLICIAISPYLLNEGSLFAYIYICPIMIIPVLFISIIRMDFKMIWYGDIEQTNQITKKNKTCNRNFFLNFFKMIVK